MSTDQIIGALGTVLFAMVTWWVKTIWSDHKETRAKLSELEIHLARDYRTRAEGDKIHKSIDNQFGGILERLDRIGNLELLLAQQYVSKGELRDLFAGIVQKLERIDDKLDKKADRV